MLKAIAAVLKHDLGLPGGMLAEDAALKYQVARSTLFLRLKDCRVGKYVLPTDTSNRSEAQAILSPKAEEKIRDWALLHRRKNDTKSSFQVRQFAAIVAQNQGLVFKTEDGLPSNGWLYTPLDGSFGTFGTTPMVLDFNSMAPSLPLSY